MVHISLLGCVVMLYEDDADDDDYRDLQSWCRHMYMYTEHCGGLPCHRSSMSSVLLENSEFSNVFQYLRYTALCIGVRIERMYRGNVMGVRLCHAAASKKRQFYSCRAMWKCYASLVPHVPDSTINGWLKPFSQRADYQCRTYAHTAHVNITMFARRVHHFSTLFSIFRIHIIASAKFA